LPCCFFTNPQVLRSISWTCSKQYNPFNRAPDRAGIDGKASAIEAYVDIDHGKMTVIDNGNGMSPETFTALLNSKGHPI
jgi:hypothetical protein